MFEKRRLKRRVRQLGRLGLAGDLDAIRELAGLGDPARQELTSLWRRLLRHGGPFEFDLTPLLRTDQLGALGAIALRPEPEVLTPRMKPGLAPAAALVTHPLGEIARHKVLAARADPGIVDEVCALACRAEPLGRFCAENGLRPAGRGRQLWFLLCSRQHEALRAELTGGSGGVSGGDGRSSGTGAGSTGTDRTRGDGGEDQGEDRSPARRAARRAARDVDGGAVRLLVSTPEPDAAWYDLDRRYQDFGRQLAQWGENDLLWRLATELPADTGAELAGRLDQDWQPATARDRTYREALGGLSRGEILRARTSPAEVYHQRIEERAFAIAVSPDGSRLAYARWTPLSGDRDRRTLIDLVDLRTRRRLATYTHRTGQWVHVRLAFCGSETLLCAGDSGLHRYDGSGADSAGTVLEEAPVGQVAAGGGRYAAATERHLLIGAGGEPPALRIELRDLGLPVPAPDPAATTSRPRTALAVSADGKRIAVGGSEVVVVLDAAGREVSRHPSGTHLPNALAFVGPRARGVALAGSYAEIQVVDREGGPGLVSRGVFDVADVGALPGPRRVVALTQDKVGGTGTLKVLEEHTLLPVGEQFPYHPLPRGEVRAMSVPPGADLFAAVTPSRSTYLDADSVTVHDLKRVGPLSLLFKPAAELSRRDVASFPDPAGDDAALRLLRARYAYFFGDRDGGRG